MTDLCTRCGLPILMTDTFIATVDGRRHMLCPEPMAVDLRTPSKVERMQGEIDELRSALAELVACKDLKDTIDMHPGCSDAIQDVMQRSYDMRKPLAWERARAALRRERI